MQKTPGFAAAHFCVAFLKGYSMTGSAWVGGALARVARACITVALHLKKSVGKRIEARHGTAKPGPGVREPH